uniref:SERPIN domain-containing protein n=1 Tax=Macrostomum lignano TaxID=282301 RepID=A0A1I8IIS6_9PLAT
MSSLTESAVRFAWSLLNQVIEQHKSENVFLSPASVQVALAMTLAGAKTETEAELSQALHLSQLKSPHSDMGRLISALNSGRQGVKLAVANRLFAERSFAIEAEFSGTLAKSYGAELGSVDFKQQCEAAREAINQWVEQQTSSKIRELLARGSLDTNTRFVLVNAIYFKGDWMDPFDRDDTYDGQFESVPGSQSPVRMMQNKRDFLYTEGRGLRLVQLPFAGDSCSMVIVLPQERHQLDAALKSEARLDNILELARQAMAREVDLHLPRFKVETQFTLSDPQYLPAMGVKRLFTEGCADLSGISKSSRDLFVSKVVHKACLEVNEEGAEAAAATATCVVDCAKLEDDSVTFNVNEPFLVLILDRSTGCVLFAAAIPRMSSLTESAVRFAWSLLNQVIEQHKSENVFLSPASVQVALAMTLAGAKTETEAELSQALHLSQLKSPHSDMGRLISALNSGRQGVKLAVANRLFAERSFAIEAEFSGTLAKSYGAKLGSVDFKQQCEAAREAINQWVEQQTSSKIRELLAQGSLDSNTRLVLVNAIYFKGDWKHTFNPESTYDGQFESAPGSQSPIRMMQQTQQFPYAEGRGLRIVQLPFAGGSCSMLIVLPFERHGLSAALQAVGSLEDILALAGSATEQEVDLHLPRFKVETQFSLSDSQYLPAMGVKRLFERGHADLSGISTAENLFVSKVVHKACLEVNEEGAEAAAVTAVAIACFSMPMMMPFFVTEPFLVLIKDEATNSVLFAGRINQPKE